MNSDSASVICMILRVELDRERGAETEQAQHFLRCLAAFFLTLKQSWARCEAISARECMWQCMCSFLLRRKVEVWSSCVPPALYLLPALGCEI